MTQALLTDNYLYALRAVALGKVFRIYDSTAFKITGPCSSRLLWSLSRMHLIADPPGGPAGLSSHGAHRERGGSIAGIHWQRFAQLASRHAPAPQGARVAARGSGMNRIGRSAWNQKGPHWRDP
jgi:hypothetical protein